MKLKLHTTFCEHYRAMSEHDTCEVGVPYSKFNGMSFDQRPCFSPDGVMRPGCDKCLLPTPEQVAERKRLMSERLTNTIKARLAIEDHIGRPWKRGTPGSQGEIDCPVCKGEKSLRFTRAGYNGHIHAACTTDGCVSWME